LVFDPVYTVIAEKYHALVLGLANRRMKDFCDLSVIEVIAGEVFDRLHSEASLERASALR
jgi:hypothetical protein